MFNLIYYFIIRIGGNLAAISTSRMSTTLHLRKTSGTDRNPEQHPIQIRKVLRRVIRSFFKTKSMFNLFDNKQTKSFIILFCIQQIKITSLCGSLLWLPLSSNWFGESRWHIPANNRNIWQFCSMYSMLRLLHYRYVLIDWIDAIVWPHFLLILNFPFLLGVYFDGGHTFRCPSIVVSWHGSGYMCHSIVDRCRWSSWNRIPFVRFPYPVLEWK